MILGVTPKCFHSSEEGHETTISIPVFCKLHCHLWGQEGALKQNKQFFVSHIVFQTRIS